MLTGVMAKIWIPLELVHVPVKDMDAFSPILWWTSKRVKGLNINTSSLYLY